MFDQSETVVWEDVAHFPICLFHLQSDRKITDADNRGEKMRNNWSITTLNLNYSKCISIKIKLTWGAKSKSTHNVEYLIFYVFIPSILKLVKFNSFFIVYLLSSFSTSPLGFKLLHLILLYSVLLNYISKITSN